MGEMLYVECDDHRVKDQFTLHALVFFYFPANGSTNPDVFLA